MSSDVNYFYSSGPQNSGIGYINHFHHLDLYSDICVWIALKSALRNRACSGLMWPVRILLILLWEVLNILSLSVLGVHNLPHLETLPGIERQYYVTVTNGKGTRKTRYIRSTGQRVDWNENLDALWEMSYFHFLSLTESPIGLYSHTPAP
jgi:hypothetical protein